jgi:hypothetical protein
MQQKCHLQPPHFCIVISLIYTFVYIMHSREYAQGAYSILDAGYREGKSLFMCCIVPVEGNSELMKLRFSKKALRNANLLSSSPTKAPLKPPSYRVLRARLPLRRVYISAFHRGFYGGVEKLGPIFYIYD